MSKVKIDFVKPIVGLDGQPEQFQDGSFNMLNKQAAQLMGNAQKGDAFKYTGWAIDAYAGKVLELDKMDADELKKFFTELTIPALLKVRILECF